jgi:signal transduction histidine kinase
VQTIRGRLAVWYAVALGATLVAFGGILYGLQRTESYPELDSRVQVETSLIAAMLREARSARGSVVWIDPQTRGPALLPDVASLLEGVPGYVVVLGTSGTLFLSAEARAMPFADVDRLIGAVSELDAGERFGLINLAQSVGTVRYFINARIDAGPEIRAVAAAAPLGDLRLAPERLLSAMLLIAPLVLIVSWLVGDFLVGRTLQPVDDIVDEVKAISDGRSLHRRLASSTVHDELARLTSTLNLMLGRLERSFSTLRRFTADASHELKTPLTVLRSGIERTITHPEITPEVMATLEETLFEVNRMTELVDSLLTLARADEGRAPLHLEQVALRDLLAELEETASILGEQAGVEVQVETPRGPIMLDMDRGRIRQLLMNLVMNAIKYTPAGGRVSVRAGWDGDDAVVRVKDTGVGIAAGDLPHIFDRFWRADAARSRTGDRPGTGLGLAISKWTVEAHGGTIDVQSRPARGTTFTVRLPAGAVAEKAGSDDS